MPGFRPIVRTKVAACLVSDPSNASSATSRRAISRHRTPSFVAWVVAHRGAATGMSG